MKYGIAIFPVKEVQDRANALRKRYDPHYNLIAPHITIKEPFEFDGSIDEIVEHLENATKNTPPFSIRVNNIKTFLPTSPVVYFAIEENPVINTLHEEVNSGILFHEMRYKFIPHITIAQGLSSQEISDTYSRLSLKEFDITFEVDRIHLCSQAENGSWSNCQIFYLKGSQ